ncbi:hypothetical protein OGAPHI_002923 [Ogataea philodendri]|uniref:uS12 prolyl 3,4-dihydroxylase n=1 Tax=Ogataea philodendri TaxID=1378263 RepID=A0A9P8P9Q4_9ASCO|nr:uncharacterized protein OGAPHI_002923 [Ogataea philodendri]KAH3667274.1 hypothetical protein OGAPHI_002923 [Ogataea philodendri]
MPSSSVVPQKRASSSDSLPEKRQISIKQTPEEEASAKGYFQQHIFDDSFKDDLKTQIADSQPYRWGTIHDLIDDDLLRNVRKEIISEISFKKKETDIYKVFQSGDLANLSGMTKQDLERLPSLYKLRSAIYSQTFRDYVSYVTNCGKLSGVKTDMSINTYSKGCHLLTHDDVIGSRRVSFILYMPEPGKTWKPHYGGSLRLFDSVVPNVPRSDHYCKFTPQFNQIAFFTVQPGLSFHDVEEVRVDKQRLSIQGWFHIPQVGEDGYIPGEQERTEAKSTLQQLETKELKEYDFPKIQYNEIVSREAQELINLVGKETDYLSVMDVDYLAKFMNPSLLTPASIERLNTIFAEESVVDVHSFLSDDYLGSLKKQIKQFELNEFPEMPNSQEKVLFPWKLAVPPHKQRYCYIDGLQKQCIDNAESIAEINQLKSTELPNFELTKTVFELLKPGVADELAKARENNPSLVSVHDISMRLCELASFFKSISFKKWLMAVTGFRPIKDQILARRFRPGHDFTLASKLDTLNDDHVLEGLLEATLNLTPSTGWESGEFGGYELCMSTDEPETTETAEEGLNEDEAAIYKASEEDSVVYESQACWNKLCLMYRDPSVLKFVKYVGFNAPGSRWDINCGWVCADDEPEESG